MKRTFTAALAAAILISTLFVSGLNAESNPARVEHPHSIGSSLFVLANYLVEDPADFYQLSYGYQFTEKDNLIIEAITWKYEEPLGTYGDSDEMYPGMVRSFGIGLGYQCFIWKGLFATAEATPFLQQFTDEDGKELQKGFQLYLQLLLGYRVELFNKRFFIEPAYALKYWPVNTNLPDSFAEVEDGAPKYIFEPSLNFGIRF